jgi:hypothetical protein
MRRLDVAKDLRSLNVKFALADNIPCGVARQHSRDKQKFVRPYARHMGVLPHRRAKLLGIVDVDFC